MIFEALQPELFRLMFHALSSKVPKIPEFNLVMCLKPAAYFVNLLKEICLKVTVRDDDSVWWYDIPPTVHSCLEQFEFCKPYPKNEKSMLLDFEVPISNSGFSEVRATVIQKWKSSDEEIFQLNSSNYLVKNLQKSISKDFRKNAELKIGRSKSN